MRRLVEIDLRNICYWLKMPENEVFYAFEIILMLWRMAQNTEEKMSTEQLYMSGHG